MATIITVFEGASALGKAVVKALSHDFDVRLATCDPEAEAVVSIVSSSPRVRAVRVAYEGDDDQSIDEALRGAHGCFVVTNTDFQSNNAYQKEVTDGRRIADACQRARINHVVFCTQLSVVRTTGIRAQHMDAKADIESYMKQLGLPVTCLILPVFYEHLLVSPLRPNKAGPDMYEVGIPIGQMPMDMIGVTDVGEAVKSIFSIGERTQLKTISLSGDKVSVKDIAVILTKYLGPKKFKDKQITVAEFGQMSFPGAEDLAAMFDFYIRVDQRAGVDTTKRLSPHAQSFPEWVHTHTAELHQALDYVDTPKKDIWA